MNFFILKRRCRINYNFGNGEKFYYKDISLLNTNTRYYINSYDLLLTLKNDQEDYFQNFATLCDYIQEKNFLLKALWSVL